MNAWIRIAHLQAGGRFLADPFNLRDTRYDPRVGMPLRLAVAVACIAPFLTLSAQRAPVLVLSHLTWFDRAGTSLGQIGPLADHGNVELSPDGTRVAVAVTDRQRGSRDIWMYQTMGGGRAQFTSDPADENWLIWSPDGTRVAMNSLGPEGIGLFETPSISMGARTKLVAPGEGVWPVSWSPNGQFILYVTNSKDTSNDVWVLPLTGDRKPYPYQQTEASENWAAFSPDGRWVAFSSTAQSGQPEVYVSRFPKADQKWRISANGGTQARWRKDSKEIFYLAPDRRLMAAAVSVAGDEFEVTGVDAMFTLTFPYGAYHAFDVTRDGQRFLVNTLAVAPGAPSLRASNGR